jgi:hypothetical protein
MLDFAVAIALTLLAATGPVTTDCQNPATWLAPGDQPVIWKGADARAMLRGLAALAMPGTPPQPAAWAAVASVIAYAAPDDEVARLHVFDANACDVGPWASIPVKVLIYVDNHLGVEA